MPLEIQSIALLGVILIAVLGMGLVIFLLVRLKVGLHDNNLKLVAICYMVPLAVMLAFVPPEVVSDKSAIFGLIGAMAGYVLGQRQA